jgi:ryanodine receptor 2
MNKKVNYIPQPIDLSDVKLSQDLLLLTEQIAANVHEIWSAGRISEGWQYGECRDDKQKQHPCLVPYDELPDSEKEYDRNTAMETLNLIVKLGFEIKKWR